MFDPRSIPAALREARDPLAAQAEDAGLNATHVPEQALVDGWLVRFSKSRIKRARCINVIGAGVLSLDEKLERAQALFDSAGQPVIFRMTPFSLPTNLDMALAERGFTAFEETRVMLAGLDGLAAPSVALPIHEVGPREFAETAGRLYGDDATRIAVDAERAEAFQGPAIRLLIGERDAPAAVACLLFDGRLAGLYGVHSRADVRGRGYAQALVATLLQRARTAGAAHAYLQVGAGNVGARSLYAKFGFKDRYAYWYRGTPEGGH
jgi:GNAT superfamily N-acetyltransferase